MQLGKLLFSTISMGAVSAHVLAPVDRGSNGSTIVSTSLTSNSLIQDAAALGLVTFTPVESGEGVIIEFPVPLDIQKSECRRPC
jgi:hypothetical protein